MKTNGVSQDNPGGQPARWMLVDDDEGILTLLKSHGCQGLLRKPYLTSALRGLARTLPATTPSPTFNILSPSNALPFSILQERRLHAA